jgi:hypothetical protein
MVQRIHAGRLTTQYWSATAEGGALAARATGGGELRQGGGMIGSVTPAAVRCSAWLRDVGIDASITDADDEAVNCEHGVKQGRLLTDE